MAIKFSLVEGELPEGINLDDKGVLHGLVKYENIGMAPYWDIPEGILGTFDEGEEAEIGPITAVVGSNRTLERVSIVPNDENKFSCLPWGLTMNPYTGIISGKIKDIPIAEDPFFDHEKPVWVTDSHHLGSINEGQSFSFTFTATPKQGENIGYFISNGDIPWGLVLDRNTGVLSGIASELKSGVSEIAEKEPKPEWITVKGSLKPSNELQEYEYKLEAKPRLGKSIVSYEILDGGLPWGLTLDRNTGIISGITSEIKIPVSPHLPSGRDPIWSDEIEVNSVNRFVGHTETIGIFNVGETLEVKFKATADSHRSIVGYFVNHSETNECSGGFVPWGLVLDRNTGILSGILSKSGTYAFCVNCMDSVGLVNSRTYVVVVNDNEMN